ncbi:tetratricopeptide repeat protein [Pseudochelatococcus sp. B33]
MLETEQVRLMTELGFAALMQGRDTEAERIFLGVRAARPEQEAGPIGLAMLALGRGDPDAAIDLLRGFSTHERALTFLGLAYYRKGDTERAIRILNTAIDLGATDLAHDLLQAIAEEEKGAG